MNEPAGDGKQECHRRPERLSQKPIAFLDNSQLAIPNSKLRARPRRRRTPRWWEWRL